MEFRLEGDFIELDNLLKAARFASSGAEAKLQIQKGKIKVNGVVESRIRRKLRLGDAVEFGDENIKVI
ncbi:MAG: RNA-binding S4 domain-containing protein [Candidatus Omnitrophota bacterium]